MIEEKRMKNIYFIGGSPCAGKSTISEIIAKKYDLYYFKVDDYLEKYMQLAANNNKPLCKKNLSLDSDGIWMRDPKLQANEEFGIYKEIFDILINDLEKIDCNKPIITEGCAYIPTLMKNLGIATTRYLSIIPTKEFQISHYQKRFWVPDVLKNCSNKDKAFKNWMERDHLFALEIKKQCDKENYKVIINDGNINIDKMINEVIKHFKID